MSTIYQGGGDALNWPFEHQSPRFRTDETPYDRMERAVEAFRGLTDLLIATASTDGPLVHVDSGDLYELMRLIGREMDFTNQLYHQQLLTMEAANDH